MASIGSIYAEQKRREAEAARFVPRPANLAHRGGLRPEHPFAARTAARLSLDAADRVPHAEPPPVTWRHRTLRQRVADWMYRHPIAGEIVAVLCLLPFVAVILLWFVS